MSYLEDAMLTLHHGDCVEVMRELPAESVDAVVTDPPYGLEFMGKEWDRLTTYAGGNPNMKRHNQAMPKQGSLGGVAYGAPQKSHRCRKCGKLLRGNGACKCPVPDIDYRRDESGFQMQSSHERWAREAFRVAKPGAHLLAFGGTRTYHRLASAIEDAGWEIRDCLVWAYASGFPKSLDVGKAIDKAAGAERERIGDNPNARRTQQDYSLDGRSRNFSAEYGPVTAPATPDAARWDGWGTALKPAWEPIVLARKPLRGTVAANVLEHGTGALNIGATRIGIAEGDAAVGGAQSANGRGEAVDYGPGGYDGSVSVNTAGRWPANLLLTDPIFDGGVPGVVGGGSVDGEMHNQRASSIFGHDQQMQPHTESVRDSGTYSRFFLVPKSSRSDREPLLRGKAPETYGGPEGVNRTLSPLDAGRELDRNPIESGYSTICAKCNKQRVNVPGAACQCADPEWIRKAQVARANSHPTVKPLELMRHLVRLVTPPGGVVLDPFLGSGTTAIAANAEGFRCIGIEREQEYLDIAVARLAHQPLGLGLDVVAPVRKRSGKFNENATADRYRYPIKPSDDYYSGGWHGVPVKEPE